MARTEWHMSAREVFGYEPRPEVPEWELNVLLAERTRMIREAEKQRQSQGG